MVSKPAIAISITQRFRVLAAIHLDDQPPVEAEKIRDVRSDRDLPPKFESV